MPGAFHAAYPHTGADGRRTTPGSGRAPRVVGPRRCRCRASPRGGENARASSRLSRISGAGSEPVVLVSLSKGTARACFGPRSERLCRGRIAKCVRLDQSQRHRHRHSARRLVCAGRYAAGRPAAAAAPRQRWWPCSKSSAATRAPLARPFVLPPHIGAISRPRLPAPADLSDTTGPSRGHARLAAARPQRRRRESSSSTASTCPVIVYPVCGCRPLPSTRNDRLGLPPKVFRAAACAPANVIPPTHGQRSTQAPKPATMSTGNAPS